MIELLIALAPTAYPAVWANDYCVYRGVMGYSHEQAVELATEATGKPTERAWLHVEENNTWCPKDEQESERN